MTQFGGIEIEKPTGPFGSRVVEPPTGPVGSVPVLEGPPEPSIADRAEEASLVMREAVSRRRLELESTRSTQPGFESQTIDTGQRIVPLTDQEFSETERKSTIEGNSVVKRFSAGVNVGAKSTARGLARVLGYDDLVNKYNTEIAGYAKLSKGLAGGAGEFTSLLPLGIAAAGSPAAPAAAIPALAAMFTTSYGNAIANIEQFEEANDVAIPPLQKTLTALGTGVLDTVFARVGFGNLREAALRPIQKDIVQAIGRKLFAGNARAATDIAIKQFVKDPAKHGAEQALLNGAYAVASNLIRKTYDPSQDLDEGVTEQMALGLAIGGVTSAAGIASTRFNWKSRWSKAREVLVKEHLLTPEESLVLESSPDKVYKISKARRDGNVVTTEPIQGPDGKITVSIKITPDVLTYGQKKALGHNTTVIDLVRSQINKKLISASDIFESPETGPVRPEEVTQTTQRLKELQSQIKLELSDYDAQLGVPTTKRALLNDDINLLVERIQKEQGSALGRNLVEQSKALITTASRKKLYTDTSPVGLQPGVFPGRTEPLTKIDHFSPDLVKLRPELAAASGYLRPAHELTDNLRLRRVITRAQEQLIGQFLAIRKRIRLPVDERYLLSKRLETDFVAKISRVLESDDNTPVGAKAQVVHLATKTKPTNAAETVKILTDSIDEIIKKYPKVSMRETVAMLLEDLQDPTKGEYTPVRESSVRLLEDLHHRMVFETEYTSYGDRIVRSLQEAQELYNQLKIENRSLATNDSLVRQTANIVGNVPPEYAKPILKKLETAKTTGELLDVLSSAIDAQSKFLKKSLVTRAVRGLRTLEKGPRAAEALGYTKEFLKTTIVSTPRPRGEGFGSARDTDIPNYTPWDLDLRDRARIALAESPERFSEISPEHRKLNDHLETLVKLNGLYPEQVSLLRYILADVNPEAIRTLDRIEEFQSGLSSNGIGYAAYYDYKTRAIALNPDVKAFRVENFVHEFLHSLHFTYMGKSDYVKVYKIWKELRDSPPINARYTSRAHEILADSRPILDQDPALLNYFASSPVEFFAEIGSRYITQKKLSVQAYQGLITRAFTFLKKLLSSRFDLTRRNNDLGIDVTDRFGLRAVPKGIKEIVDALWEGKGDFSTALTSKDRMLGNRETRGEYYLYFAGREKISDSSVGTVSPKDLWDSLDPTPQPQPF